jgi:hypothetical protein
LQAHFKTLGWILTIIGILTALGGCVLFIATPLMERAVNQLSAPANPSSATPNASTYPAPPGSPAYPQPAQPGASGQPSMPGQPGMPGTPMPGSSTSPLGQATGAIAGVMRIAAAISLVIGILWIINGWSLLARKDWARIFTIVVALLSIGIWLFMFVSGFKGYSITLLLNVYALIVMFSGSAAAEWKQYSQ